MAATEAVASEVVVEVSVGEIVEAMEEVPEDLEGATKWVEGWSFADVVLLHDHKIV